jgi:hypothetical protein
MKVATLISNLSVGGAEHGLLRLVRATRSEFDHQVISLVDGGELAQGFRDIDVLVVEAGIL